MRYNYLSLNILEFHRGNTIKQNYLNNRDILKEIHLSKNTYCSYKDREVDHKYDIILPDINSINEYNINVAKTNRIAKTLRETGKLIRLEDIPNTDLVFRITMWEHVPMLPPKIDKANKLLKKLNTNRSIDKFFDTITDDNIVDEEFIDVVDEPNELTIIPTNNIKADHIKVNFPPFYHYRLDENNELYVVGKSHWCGDLETGYFSKTHGYLTDTLALMIVKLCEKYASNSKFRGYSYRDEFVGQAVMQLVQVCLMFNEEKSENPFSFFTSCAHNSFLRILNIEKKNRDIRDTLLEQNHMSASYTRANQTANNFNDE